MHHLLVGIDEVVDTIIVAVVIVTDDVDEVVDTSSVVVFIVTDEVNSIGVAGVLPIIKLKIDNYYIAIASYLVM